MSSKGIKDVIEVDQPEVSGDSKTPQKQSSDAASASLSTSVYGSGLKESPKSRVSSPDMNEYVSLSHEDSVADCTFEQLIKKFRDGHYNINQNTEELILVKCKLLLERDYELKILKNDALTDNYPKEILIPTARKNAPENEKPMNFDAELFSELVHEARVSRLRSRVVVPTVLFDNKYICRSGTLTVLNTAIYEIAIRYPKWPSEKGKDAGFSAVRQDMNVTSSVKNILQYVVESLASLAPDMNISSSVQDIDQHGVESLAPDPNVSSSVKGIDQHAVESLAPVMDVTSNVEDVDQHAKESLASDTNVTSNANGIDQHAEESLESFMDVIPSAIDCTQFVKEKFQLFMDACSDMSGIAAQAMQSLINIGMMENLLNADLKVMKYLNVEHICDLMVEYNKQYNQQINLSSTEKVHESIYKDIKIEEMPFPGCEFFRSYKEADRIPEGLFFEWGHGIATRSFKLTDDRRLFFPELNPQKWTEWDLVEMTCNYLKIMLSYLVTSTGGMDVHCVSGWDRTPLFVSLLRLSLWADGLVHESLNAEEMAYFTVAYDWFLFGHNLKDRIKKGEEIMHFAFNFLQYITSDDFSVIRMFNKLPEDERRGRNFPEFVPGRRIVLSKVRDCVLNAYNEHISTLPPESKTWGSILSF